MSDQLNLCNKAANVIAARGVWEQKQRLFYQARHDGLRRRNKPWPSAADLHFPLIDMNIRKFKPFYMAQALSADRLANFVSLTRDSGPTAEAASEFFDYEVKNHTAFTRKLRGAVDTMLLRSRGILKITVDPFNDYQIVVEQVDPVFILMPDTANDFVDADWFVHVKHLSVPKYQADRRFDQSPTTLARIRGSKDQRLAQFWQDKELREGITHTKADDVIVLWEHYEKTPGGWTVYVYSPQAPDLRLRAPFGMPYKFQGKPSLPFFSFLMEVKDDGWYAPRGLSELCMPFEVYATKLWNDKADAMTFGNRPLFTADKEIPNTTNLRWMPGELIPGNIRAVQMPQPAISFDQEISFARATSEQLSMMPDFGTVDAGNSNGRPRTATENNRIAQLQQVGTNDNGLQFREDLALAYRHMWGLMLQFKRKQMAYLVGNELRELPEQALHDQYLVLPAGATDQWDRQMRLQRAMQRLQTFKGAPNVDQDELTREALAADDPIFAQRAFIATGQKANSEAEDEAMEIVIMCDGFPAAVLPQEDHATRIHVLVSWLMKQQLTGAPVDPTARQRIQQHLMVHWQYLKQLQPQVAKQVAQQIAQAEAQVQQQQLAQQQQPQPPPPPAAPGAGAPAMANGIAPMANGQPAPAGNEAVPTT